MRESSEATRGAVVSEDAGGHAALERGAALVDLHEKVLRLSGKNPVGMLNAVLTNDLPSDAFTGVYAMLLNPKGRIQTDLRALKSGDEVLIVTEPEGAGAAKEILGRYAPFSRVKLEEGDLAVLGLYGPGAKDLIGAPDLAEHASTTLEIGGAELLAVGVAVPVPGYDLIGPSDTLAAARKRLVERGATPAGREAHETARIEAGVPRFGADITPQNFPGETDALDRAVSFQKGCYPGQETVARMHYRGRPNKILKRLAIEGPPPAPGEDIVQNGKRMGSITSVAPLPVDGRTLALGYLSRAADPDGDLRAGAAVVRVRERA